MLLEAERGLGMVEKQKVGPKNKKWTQDKKVLLTCLSAKIDPTTHPLKLINSLGSNEGIGETATRVHHRRRPSHGMCFDNSGWLGFLIAFELLIVYLTLGGANTGAEAACLGQAADHCEFGLRSIPCPRQTSPQAKASCCIPCEDTVIPPPSPPPIKEPPPIVVQPPTPLPCTLPPEVISSKTCIKRDQTINDLVEQLYPGHKLKSCRELDDLILQIEERQTDLQRKIDSDSTDAVARWLSRDAFIGCGDMVFSLQTLNFREQRRCRGVLKLHIEFGFSVTWALLPVYDPPVGACPILEFRAPVNRMSEKDRMENYTYTDVFYLETRQPSLDELEERTLLTSDNEQQCLIDLPGHGENRQQNRTLLVGPDCYGGSVPVTYRLRTDRAPLVITSELLKVNDSCIDNQRISYIWETHDPITGDLCPNDTLRLDFEVRDTTPPIFVESITPSDDQVILLPCYADLANYVLEFVDNCDRGRRQRARVVETIAQNTSTDATCRNSASASVVFEAKDTCGNIARRTLHFAIRDTHPPSPITALQSSNPKKCRRHVPPPTALSVSDNCLPGITSDVQARRTYTFDQGFQPRDAVNARVGIDDFEETNLLCENKLTIMDTYQLCDGCSPCVNVSKRFPVNDVDPPLWTSPNLPALHLNLQCRKDLLPFKQENHNMILWARDDCDQIDIEVIGVEENWGPPNGDRHFGSCKDNTQIVRRWKACDTCGNCAERVQSVMIRDRTPPALVDGFNHEKSHFCLASSESTLNRFICFPEITNKMSKLIKGDNCGHEIYMDFLSVETFGCTDPEHLPSCTHLLSSFTNKHTSIDRSVTQYNRYYEHNDTLCVARQGSLMHVIKFEAGDMCGNSITVPIDIFTPKRSTDDKHYDPAFPNHPCDGRTVLPMPIRSFESQSTSFGAIYQANRLEARFIKKTVTAPVPVAQPKGTSGTTRLTPPSRMFIVGFTLVILFGLFMSVRAFLR